MPPAKRNRNADRSDQIPPNAPRLIRINPDGRREVDPMSIIRSDRAQKHLNDIKGLVPPKREAGEP